MKLRLNLGCGTKAEEGYINIDIRPLSNIDIVADVMRLPIKDNSIDEIRAFDIYEHIPFSKSQQLLRHWCEKLKNGGKLIMGTPSLDKIISFHIHRSSLGDVETAIHLLYGAQDYPENFHYTVGHPALLDRYLQIAGFENIQIISSIDMNLIIKGSKK